MPDNQPQPTPTPYDSVIDALKELDDATFASVLYDILNQRSEGNQGRAGVEGFILPSGQPDLPDYWVLIQDVEDGEFE